MKIEELLRRRTDLLARWRAQAADVCVDRGPVDLREVWRREYYTHTEIKVTYAGDPDERIPAYLLIPRDAGASTCGIVALHQCGCLCDVGKEQVVGKCVDLPDQAYGLELVRRGCVVLAPDVYKVGERYDPRWRQAWERGHPGFRPDGMWGQSICCSITGGPAHPEGWCKTVFDVMRAVDVLQATPNVDPRRIGIIGHSMGAGLALTAMPLDDRIGAAAVSGVGCQVLDRLIALAPRPVLDIAGTRDPSNWGQRPEQQSADLGLDERMQAKRQLHAQARTVYAALGNADTLGYHEFDGDHSFPADARQAAYEWLDRWLLRQR